MLITARGSLEEALRSPTPSRLITLTMPVDEPCSFVVPVGIDEVVCAGETRAAIATRHPVTVWASEWSQVTVLVTSGGTVVRSSGAAAAEVFGAAEVVGAGRSTLTVHDVSKVTLRDDARVMVHCGRVPTHAAGRVTVSTGAAPESCLVGEGW